MSDSSLSGFKYTCNRQQPDTSHINIYRSCLDTEVCCGVPGCEHEGYKRPDPESRCSSAGRMAIFNRPTRLHRCAKCLAPSFIITAVWPRLPETILNTSVLSFWAMKGCFEVVVGYTRVCRLSLSNSQIGE